MNRTRWQLPARDYRRTQCGLLQVERFVGTWGAPEPAEGSGADPELGRWAQLVELESGRILVETSCFERSEFRFQEDGSLLLWLRYRHNEGMLRIDTRARQFRNLSLAEPPRPLAQLADATAAELRRLGAREPVGLPAFDRRELRELTHRFSRDGRLRIDLLTFRAGRDCDEDSPRVVLTETGETVLDLVPEWNCEVAFWPRGELYLKLWKDSFRANLIIAPDGRSGAIEGAGPARLPLADLQRELERRAGAA